MEDAHAIRSLYRFDRLALALKAVVDKPLR